MESLSIKILFKNDVNLYQVVARALLRREGEVTTLHSDTAYFSTAGEELDLLQMLSDFDNLHECTLPTQISIIQYVNVN